MSRLSFRDNNLGKASETLDEKARHEMPSYPIRQPSASRLFDCFVTSGLASQDTDQLVCWLIQSQWRPSQLCRLRYTSAQMYSASFFAFFILLGSHIPFTFPTFISSCSLGSCLLAIFYIDNTHLDGYRCQIVCVSGHPFQDYTSERNPLECTQSFFPILYSVRQSSSPYY